ncbi:neutral zinc metallopeptidase [Kribbella sp. NPDC051586]|uniref:neutral zinc metallopeptidase n=1 Tax=Kribbella sp. NPDC051586 TaxID=3364118 RepID=UPI0037AE5CBD
MSGNQWGPPPGQFGPPPQQRYAAPPPPQQYYAPPPPPGPQFGWGPMPPQPPRKKKSGGTAVLIVALIAAVATGGVFTVIKLKHSNGHIPTAAAPPTTRTTAPRPTRAVPTKKTTTTTPTKPARTVNPATYNATHRLYKTGAMRTVNCKQAKTGPGNGAQALAYFKSIKACLDRAWPKQVAAAGGRFDRPGLVLWGGTVDTPCGSAGPGRSFYCSATHTIYMEVPSAVSYYKENPTFGRMADSFTMAHEYGHSVQWMTGIGQAYDKLRYDASSDGQLQLSRRLELQASCLGNVFLGANRSSYHITGYAYQMWLYDVNGSGDRPPYPRDHGSTTNHGAWSRAAFASRNPASCNTWSASPARVS